MKQFKPADVPDSELQLVIDATYKRWKDGDKFLVPGATSDGEALALIEKIVREEHGSCLLFLNDVYQVALKRMESLVHLSIKRIDRQPLHDWRELQEIKNQLVGPECEGVELYPAESRCVDVANQYHLWVCTDAKYRFPFGFDSRMVDDKPIGKSVNRKLKFQKSY